jgi:hypothetical protein
VSVHCSVFEPLKFLNFDFNADPDLAFHSNVDPEPASKNNADPDRDPQQRYLDYGFFITIPVLQRPTVSKHRVYEISIILSLLF